MLVETQGKLTDQNDVLSLWAQACQQVGLKQLPRLLDHQHLGLKGCDQLLHDGHPAGGHANNARLPQHLRGWVTQGAGVCLRWMPFSSRLYAYILSTVCALTHCY